MVRLRTAALTLAILFTPVVTPAQQIALTFDDLPNHGALPAGMTRADVARSILKTLQKAKAPRVYGFINARQLEAKPEDQEVLKLWRAAGFPLANHSYSHMDLHANQAEDFERDVIANETALRSLMGDEDWRWFRYPYLREGDTLEKREAVRAFLVKRGYRIAQVTVDFHDYAFNAPYARCVERKDSEGIDGLKAAYLKAASEALSIQQNLAREIYGREIKHVLLLHIGAFETVMLPHLMTLLESQRFKLITLEEAHTDDAYKSDPGLAMTYGDTLLGQMVRAKKLKPPQRGYESLMKQLDAACR